MATLPETPEFTPDIYQIETTDKVLGGPDGAVNIQSKQVANRTAWLKEQVEAAASVANDANTKANSALAQIANAETAMGNAAASAAAANQSKTDALTAKALAEQANTNAQAARADAAAAATGAAADRVEAGQKAAEAQASATAAIVASNASATYRDAANQAKSDTFAARDETLVAAAAADAQAAVALSSAATATDQAMISTAQAGVAVAAKAAAESARDAALLSRGVFATTAKALSKGVVGVASLVGGSGGANGTFDLAFSGGDGSGAAGRFVVAGGAVVSVTITAAGDSYTSEPTISFAASSGLTGASATAVIANNVAAGEYFSVPSAESAESLVLYLNNAGTAVYQKTYPSSSTVATQKLELSQLHTGSLKSFVNAAYPTVYSRGSYLTGAVNAPADTVFGWRSPFKHNGSPFNAVQLNFRGATAGVFRVEIQSSTFQVLASGQVDVGTSNAVLTVPLNRMVYEVAANQVCYIAYYDPNKSIPAGRPQAGAYDAGDADPAVNPEHYYGAGGWAVAGPAGNYRIHFRLVNTNANPRNFADELTTLNSSLQAQAVAAGNLFADVMAGFQPIAGAVAASAQPVFSRGSYSAGSVAPVTPTLHGWKSVFKHNGQPFNMVRFTTKSGSASAIFRVEIWKTDGTVLAAGSFQTIGGTASTAYAVQLNRIVTALVNGADAYFVLYHPERTVGVGNPAAGAYDAADASPTTYPDQYLVAAGTWITASPVNGYRIQFDAINTATLTPVWAEINAKSELRSAIVPYVVWSHPLGDAEMTGNAVYAASTIAGFYEQTTQSTVFNAVQGRIWCPDASTAIEWRVWIRETSATFNMQSVAPDASGTIPAGKFPTTDTIYTLQLAEAIKAPAGKYVFVMFRAANGTTLRHRSWGYDASVTPARHGFPFTTLGNGWNNTISFGAPTLGYGQVAPKLLLESQELRTKSAGNIASGIAYSNATSGLSANDVQAAIDALAAGIGGAPEMVMPPTIYAVEGRECNLYIDNLHLGDSAEYFHDVTSASGTGTQQNERWTWTPSAAMASGSLTVDANDKRSGALLRSVTAQQRAAAASAGSGLNKRVMMIGDSLTNGGVITQTLLDIAAQDVMGVTLVGTRGTAPNLHEGRGGWTINDYSTVGRTYYQFNVSGVSVVPAINSTEYSNNGSVYRVQEVNLSGGTGTITCSVTSGGAPLASGTLIKTSGAGDDTIAFSASAAVSGNPFWFGGVVNFAQYLSTHGFSAPDWVFIHLGTNDMASYTSDASASAAADVAFGKLDTLIASIKSANESTKIGVCIPPPPSSDQDSFGANYGTSLNRHRFKRNILVFARQLIAKYAGQEGGRVYVVPSNTALDTVNNMMRSSPAPANSRTSIMISRQSNGVHPDTSGYKQIGDALWAFLKFYA